MLSTKRVSLSPIRVKAHRQERITLDSSTGLRIKRKKKETCVTFLSHTFSYIRLVVSQKIKLL